MRWSCPLEVRFRGMPYQFRTRSEFTPSALSDAGKLSELRVFGDVTSGGSGRSLARAALRLEGLLLRL